MSKIYLPNLLKNKQELFSIASSKDGLIIPLTDFGYPDMHMTLFLKEIEPNLILFNFHIKDELSNKLIVTKSIKCHLEELDEWSNKKIDRLKEIFDYYFDKWDKKQINSKNLVCVNCFIEQTMLDLPLINKRKNAEKCYKSIFSLASDKDLLRKYPVCTKSKHTILYDILQDKLYYKIELYNKSNFKIDNYIITQKELDEFMNSMKSVFKEELEIIPEFFDYIEKEFKSKINPKTK